MCETKTRSFFCKKVLRKMFVFRRLDRRRQQRPYKSGAPYTIFGVLKVGLWRPKFRPCQSLPLNWTMFFEFYIKNTFFSHFQSVLKLPHSKVRNSKFYYCNSLSGAKMNIFKMQIFLHFPLKCPKLISRHSSVTFKLSILQFWPKSMI